MDGIGIDIEFLVNSAKLDKSLDNMKKNIQILKKEISVLNKELKFDPKNTETLNRKIENLNAQIEIGERRLNGYIAEMEKLQKAQITSGEKFDNTSKRIQECEKDLENMRKQLAKAKQDLENATQSTGAFSISLQDIGDAAKGIGTELRYVSRIARNFLNDAIESAVEYENAFTDLKKTLTLTDEELEREDEIFDEISDGLRELAKEVPTTATELATIAGLAGQMGVGADDVVAFTKAMVDFANATNITAEEATQEIAQIYNVIGKGGDYSDLDNLLSTIVELGNNSATTEKDIVSMFRNISAASSRVGMTSQQMVALASTLSSLGLDKAGASSISTIMSKIDLAVDTNAKSLKDWAQAAHMSTKQFKEAWQEDAAGALVSLLEGLKQTVDAGGNLNEEFADLGIKEMRRIDTLGRLVNGQEIYKNSLEMANDAYDEHTALTEEASKRYATMASRMQVLSNNFEEFKMLLGESIMPLMESFVNSLMSIATWMQGLNTNVLQFVAIATGILAILSPLLIYSVRIIESVVKMKKYLSVLLTPLKELTAHGLAVVGWVAAVIALLVILYKNSEEFRTLVGNIVKMVWGKLEPVLESLWSIMQDGWLIIKKVMEEIGLLFDMFMNTSAGKFFAQTILNIVDVLTAFLEVIGWVLKGVAKFFGLITSGFDTVRGDMLTFNKNDVISPSGKGMYQSGGFSITMNNSFNVNGDPSVAQLNQWADVLTDRVNENLGRMYAV